MYDGIILPMGTNSEKNCLIDKNSALIRSSSVGTYTVYHGTNS